MPKKMPNKSLIAKFIMYRNASKRVKKFLLKRHVS